MACGILRRMPKRSSKDPNQVAASILQQVMDAAEETPAKNPAAVALAVC